MTGFRSDAVVALGGNLRFGDAGPGQTLVRAIAALALAGGAIRAVSRFYATPCHPAGAGPDYVNAAVLVRTGLAPEALLAALHRIEAGLGRDRQQRWGMRTLDLDLVCMGALVLPDRDEQRRWIDLDPAEQGRRAPDRLILPHPRMQDRAFVLVPMADVAPDWRHPVLGRTTADLCAALPRGERAAIRPL